ncbi:MAG: hypothetical protein QOC82_2964, partial [Frankiaceae bacterium]|nr:hypothetical protein [Frankiaceae bacterium]
SPAGARAIVALLRQQGVTVDVIERLDRARSAPDTTVVVPVPEDLGPDDLALLSESRSDVVLIAPDNRALELLGIPFEVSGDVSADEVGPHCGLPAATAAGTVTIDGPVYTSRSATQACYPVAGQHAVVVRTTDTGRTFTVIGSHAVFANHTLGDDGNAALALNLIATHQRVEWLVPIAPTAATGGDRHSLVDLLPGRLGWAVLELVVALTLFAISRGRRLGPLVTEPLPVVVRATETVEGRARLLRGARARRSSAEALRAAARRRLSTRLGLGPAPAEAALVDRITTRTSRGANEVNDLLYGSSPVDDRGLVALATALDRLEEEMRRQ